MILFVFALTAIALFGLLWTAKRYNSTKALAIVQTLCVPFGLVPGLLTFFFLRQGSVRDRFRQANSAGNE